MNLNKDELIYLNESTEKQDSLEAILGITQAISNNKQSITEEIQKISEAISSIEIPEDKTEEIVRLVSAINEKSFDQSDKQIKILVESIKAIVLESRKASEEIVEKLSIIGNAEIAIKELNKNLELDRKAEWEFHLTRKNGELEKVRAIRTA